MQPHDYWPWLIAGAYLVINLMALGAVTYIAVNCSRKNKATAPFWLFVWSVSVFFAPFILWGMDAFKTSDERRDYE